MQEKMKKNTENRRKRAKKEIARGKKNPIYDISRYRRKEKGKKEQGKRK